MKEKDYVREVASAWMPDEQAHHELMTTRLEFLEHVARSAMIMGILVWKPGEGVVVTDKEKLYGLFDHYHRGLPRDQQEALKNWKDLFRVQEVDEGWRDGWAAILKLAEYFKDEW